VLGGTGPILDDDGDDAEHVGKLTLFLLLGSCAQTVATSIERRPVALTLPTFIFDVLSGWGSKRVSTTAFHMLAASRLDFVRRVQPIPFTTKSDEVVARALHVLTGRGASLAIVYWAYVGVARASHVFTGRGF
jgi:hypothetical protein